jgi:hypothetical protein
VQLGGDIPNLIVKHAIDERMNVLVRAEWLGTRRQLLTDYGQPALDPLTFLEGKHAGTPKRDCPSLR